MNELKKMMLSFFAGEYDPFDFSFDLPEFLIQHHAEIEAEAPGVYQILANDIPEICADYEPGMDPTLFMDAVKREYEKALAAV